jgi:hypothetical protein
LGQVAAQAAVCRYPVYQLTFFFATEGKGPAWAAILISDRDGQMQAQFEILDVPRMLTLDEGQADFEL